MPGAPWPASRIIWPACTPWGIFTFERALLEVHAALVVDLGHAQPDLARGAFERVLDVEQDFGVVVLAAPLEIAALRGERAPPMRPKSSEKKSLKSAASPGEKPSPRPECSKPASQSGGGRKSCPGW